MTRRFVIGDHVVWNSEAGRASGTITAVHTRDFNYKGHVRHASEDDPQHEIKSGKTDHVAADKGARCRTPPRWFRNLDEVGHVSSRASPETCGGSIHLDARISRTACDELLVLGRATAAQLNGL